MTNTGIAMVTAAQVQARMRNTAWVPMTSQASVLIVGANGSGKTGLITRVLYPLLERERVLSIDVKGDDHMWSGYGAPLESVTPGMLGGGDGPAGHWWRLVVDLLNDRARAVREVRHAINLARNEGHMVLVADESRTITDPEPNALGLRAPLEDVLTKGRSRFLQVIAAAQSTEYMAASVRNQWAVMLIGAMRDDIAIRRALELAGLWDQRKTYLPVVRNMPPRTWLYVDRAEGRPAIGLVRS